MANSSWYVLYIRPITKDGKPKKMAFPLMGRQLVHVLGNTDDDEKLQRDRKNPMWPIIQDENRPAWAPDLLRLGYAVVFRRDGLPKLAVRLGIQDPEKIKKQGRGIGQSNQRVLTFDDVWVVAVNPNFTPFPMPKTSLSPAVWWSQTRESATLADPFIAPGGGQIVVGAQRLSDVVRSMLSSPEGYPRPIPGLEPSEQDSLREIVNPMLPRLPVVRNEPDQPGYSGQLDHFAGLELFRY